jgi:hypothetical protein
MAVSIQELVSAIGIIAGLECAHIKEILRLRSFKWMIINIKSRVGRRLARILLKRKELYFCRLEVQII